LNRVERRLINKNMKFNFRKISAMAASLLVTGMSVGVAAAANYPAPFVQGGIANVAVVYGTGSGVSALDLVQAGNIQSNLQSQMGSTSTGTGATTTGETVQLFSGGTKIYLNDSMNAVKSVLTKSDLPTVLSDETFSGNVDAKITQQITLGSYPKVTYKKQPTNDDDPNFALTLSTSTTNMIYNASATMSKAVNFSHSDSEGQSLTLFGQKFTVSADTSSTSIVLLQSAEKISLDSEANPSQEVTIAGITYTVELVSASDTAATIKVTDGAGNSESREVNEADSKKINGLTVAVTNADETNLKLSASVVAGSEKVTLTHGSEVSMGEDDTIIDGTTAYLIGGTGATTQIAVAIAAKDSDYDAIKAGESFVDPIFESFKLDFAGVNIGADSTARELITLNPNGDDRMDIKFSEHRGNEKTITFLKNETNALELEWDDEDHEIHVMEGANLTYKAYVVVGNEDEGYLLKLSSVKNQTTGYSNDYAKFTDVFSGDLYETTWTGEGSGTLTVGGKSFGVTLSGLSAGATETFGVTLDYPDSSGTGDAVIYPTIQTPKGAKVFFYEPLNVSIDVATEATRNVTTLRMPDGDGYTDVVFTHAPLPTNDDQWTVTVGGTAAGSFNTSLADATTLDITIGQLTYQLVGGEGTADNITTVKLEDVGGTSIAVPALVIFEEKDDNNEYHALITKFEYGASSDDGIGIDDVERTVWTDNSDWESTMPGDSKITKEADLWGTLVTTDASDSDQKTAEISYPDEQLYVQLYVGEEDSSVVAGTSGTTSSTPLGEVLVMDSEVSSVSSKNLIIVGGSCINSAAATVLGGAYCGAAFTDSTGVGSGQFLIQGFDGAYTAGKLALVVAGYEAADTVNAATYLKTKTVDTMKKYIGTSATSAEMVVEATV
jgi:hypothetical protein